MTKNGLLSRALLILVLVLGLLQAATAATARQRQNLINLNIQSTDIHEVYELLARQSRTNIILSGEVNGEVSINLYDVTLDKAVNLVALAAGFVVEKIKDTYFVSTRKNAGKEIAGGLTELRTVKVQYSNPTQIADILKKHLSRFGKITPLPERRLLVIEDLPDFVRRIQQLVMTLDRKPAQILIDARILEITLNENQLYGLDWEKLFRGQDGTGALGISGLAAPGTPGFFFNVMNSNIELQLNALGDKGRVRTLASPKLLAMEHQEAVVIIGDRQGYVVTTTINQVTTESVNFLESGVILRVTAYIDESGKIMMNVHPEVSTGTVADGIPSQNTTEVSTQLLSSDGKTIFIGGLIRNSTSETRTGVPLLMDIPYVRYLFSATTTNTLETETIVLLTPRIIRHEDDLVHEQRKRYSEEVGEILKRESKTINDVFENREW